VHKNISARLGGKGISNQHKPERKIRRVENQGVGNLPADADLKKWGDSNFLPTKSKKWAR